MRTEKFTGGDEARRVLGGMIFNAKVLSAVAGAWDQYEGGLGSREADRIGGWAVRHFQKTSKAPGKRGMLTKLQNWKDKNPRSAELAQGVEDLLAAVLREHEHEEAPADVDTVEHFLNAQRMRRIADIAQAGGNGKLDRSFEHIGELWKPIRLGGNDDRYVFAGKTPAELLETVRPPETIVEGILVALQTAVMGAVFKGMKTSIGIDKAVSIASGTPFLGKFPVPKARPVAYISGESGEWATLDIAKRVCEARNRHLKKRNNLFFDFRLPQLGRDEDVQALVAGLKAKGIEVCFFDPLYLSLLAGTKGLEASNIYDMGPLLSKITRACISANCTPVLIHHLKKGIPIGEPAELGDLAFSGVAEYARQWLLLNRRERFDPEAGVHKLWLNVGGSCGQSGLYGVYIHEGRMADDFTGRKWRVTVTGAGKLRNAERQEKEEAKKTKKEQETDKNADAVLAALNRLDPKGKGAGWIRVSELAGVSARKMTPAVFRLIERGEAVETEVMVPVGSGAERSAKGLKLCV